MLWENYVFNVGDGVSELWESMYSTGKYRTIYITGNGFDARSTKVLENYVATVYPLLEKPENVDLLLVDFQDFEISDELRELTEKSEASAKKQFDKLGTVKKIPLKITETEESATAALQRGVLNILQYLNTYDDIVLDVSSLPKSVYVSIITAILRKLVPNPRTDNSLNAGGVNFQVLVADDPELDKQITSDDPDNDLLDIPGFKADQESVKDWQDVWLPALGEGKSAQLEKISRVLGTGAEVCPIIPHPSRDPRRGDRLLLEHRKILFDSRETTPSNLLLVHESNPFEVYRQVRAAMIRYAESMELIEGCRLIVSPLTSKLITAGICLACYELKALGETTTSKYVIGIPYVQPRRYDATSRAIESSQFTLNSMLLTGSAYT